MTMGVTFADDIEQSGIPDEQQESSGPNVGEKRPREEDGASQEGEDNKNSIMIQQQNNGMGINHGMNMSMGANGMPGMGINMGSPSTAGMDAVLISDLQWVR